MELDVCFAPDLFEAHAKANQLAVIIDVVRMSTSVNIAFEYGIDHIIPLAKWEEALPFRDQGYLISGERNSYQLEGFDLGNSPFDFMKEELKGAKLAMSTTNGTYAIEQASASDEVVIGSYINEKALVDYLLHSKLDILLICAGWNRRENAEDSLFAGKLIHDLKKHKTFEMGSDAALLAEAFYRAAPSRYDWVIAHSHRFTQHLPRLENDIRFCLEPPYELGQVPRIENKRIIL